MSSAHPQQLTATPRHACTPFVFPRTVEADSVRPVRFRTDAVTSANMGVPAGFRLGETRKLPGKPKAVDRFVAKVML